MQSLRFLSSFRYHENSFLDGFAYYEEWQDVMKKADEEAKVLLRHYGDTLKQRDDVCHLILRSDR